jgi:hypothetical protein
MPRLIPWNKVDQEIAGLPTDREHDIYVQREALPIIFVPGIMGSRLRRSGGWHFSELDLPQKRWDPSNKLWMALNYLGLDAGTRKRMLVGPRFSSGYLEVIQKKGKSNGFEGIMEDYWGFLENLTTWQQSPPEVGDRESPLAGQVVGPWGPMGKIFTLPVYAFGYDWTGKVEDAGAKLKERITKVIAEARGVTGLCEKVILITHSMGGLVARWASEKAGAKGDILGIIHGVQPVTGAPAAYWRMKAGFEGDTGPALVLGYKGPKVTAVLGNIPGGLSLLPNKLHRTNGKSGSGQWLRVIEDGFVKFKLPKSSDHPNPYDDIYRVKAVVSPAKDGLPEGNAYWGLVDPDLLDPDNTLAGAHAGSVVGINAIDAQVGEHAWDVYLYNLRDAERLHDQLGDLHHDVTFCSQGDHKNDEGKPHTADVVEFRVEPRTWDTWRNYPGQGFRGFLRDASGNRLQATLQDPNGCGDGTVPLSSSGRLNDFAIRAPGHSSASVEHQPAYEKKPIQDFTRAAIAALCLKRYEEVHG